MIFEKNIEDDILIKKIKEFSPNAFLVGGVIRDWYLRKENFDKDIATFDAKNYAKGLADFLDAYFVPLDEINNIYRIVLKDKINYIDVAQIVGNSIEDDLKRRDLTINSIAYDLKSSKFIDINNGFNDLDGRIIRHIDEKNFIDDPLRLLRAFRFQSTMDFNLDCKMCKFIQKNVDLINNPSKERVSYELIKLFGGKNAHGAILAMDNIGLLDKILSVSNSLKEIPPNSHHHLNLFMHSIESVKQIQILYEKSSEEIKKHLDKVEFGGNSRLAHLKFAGFLHDIGKPDTWTIEEDTGRHRFIKHDDVGSKKAVKILKDLKLSKKQIDYICKMIKYHIYPSHVISSPELTEKIFMRFVRKMDASSIDVIFLAMADRLSARGVEITDEIVEKNILNLTKLLNFYMYVKDSLQPLPKLLSGNEIMEILRIPQSKELGKIVKELREAQISGEVTTKEEAFEFVKKQK